MAKDSRNGVGGEGTGVDGATSLEAMIRRRARGWIDAIVEEELDAALGAARSARVGEGRQGVLKIDQSFIHEISADPVGTSIVCAVISMGKSQALGSSPGGAPATQPAAWIGSVKQKVLPSPTRLSAQIRPPCPWTMHLEM